MDMKFVDEGRGRVILIVHGGMGDSSAWARVARPLARRYRVIRLHRRRYRLDLAGAGAVTIAEEVEDVLALAGLVGEPVLLVGHSSGGVIALEAAAAAPALFAGLVVYEPPVVLGDPLGGRALCAARAAVAAGKPGKAIAIFERDILEVGVVARTVFRMVVAALPQLRAYVPRQLDDVAAIDSLGSRLSSYAAIELPTVLLSGDRSPAHLGKRVDALRAVMPKARKIVMAGQAHNANDFAPHRLARLIEDFAAEAFS
ncbi:alpha/beta fold hydrolase [Nocardia suismassiliense]|uniref:Alpha/beta fold hydrolase n=1 Tax=Nocardia suismassiliense TaxID=2077092 RepID=A0ABW6R6B8_9NOCA